MATQALPKTGLEKWKEGIDKAINDSRWNIWDCEIQKTVNEYNRHLSGVAGYRALDWQLIKAMLWVESGATNSEWNSKPMRIGVSGDPGLTSLLSGKERGDLILPFSWKKELTISSVRTIPVHNIRAGIGHLLMKMAYYEYRSVLGSDQKIYDIIVKSGDSFEKIAWTHVSTIEVIKTLNPMANMLRPGQHLKYQKSSTQRVITNWRPLSTLMVAQRYNGGGDIHYVTKIDYALNTVRKGGTIICGK